MCVCLLVIKTDGVDLWLESLCRFSKIMLTQHLLHLPFCLSPSAARRLLYHPVTYFATAFLHIVFVVTTMFVCLFCMEHYFNSLSYKCCFTYPNLKIISYFVQTKTITSPIKPLLLDNKTVPPISKRNDQLLFDYLTRENCK